MHAHCLEVLQPHLTDRSVALDVGSGSGYLLACMRNMVGPKGKVYGVEHIQELVDVSIENIKNDGKSAFLEDGPTSISVAQGDGRLGYPEAKSNMFDCIHVGAASPAIPTQVLKQS